LYRRPTVTLLVGDSAHAALLREDLFPNAPIRSFVSWVVTLLIKWIQSSVGIPGFVAEFLREKYASHRSDATIANESWLQEHMFQPPRDRMSSRPTILFVGRLIERKRVHMLIDVLIELLQDGRDLQVIIVGDGPLRSALENKVHFSGYETHFQFAGWIQPLSSDLLHYYRRSDILCLPSFAEGLPLVLLEAMANGVAVIATDVSGIPEVVKHEDTGILVPRDNAIALKHAITRLLDEPWLWHKCVVNAYTLAHEHTYAKQRGKLAQAILDVLECERQ